MTLHDDLLGDIYSAAPRTDVVEEAVPETAGEEGALEVPPADDLWDSFNAGCLQTWDDVRAWGKHPRDALAAFKHWQPPSAAGHDIYVESVTDRFEALHQRWIGRGGVRLGVAWIGLVQRGRVFWPVFLTATALAVTVLLITH